MNNMKGKTAADCALQVREKLLARLAAGEKPRELGFKSDDDVPIFLKQLGTFMFAHPDVNDDEDEEAVIVSRAVPGDGGGSGLERTDGALGVAGWPHEPDSDVCRRAIDYCKAVQGDTHNVNWVAPRYDQDQQRAVPKVALLQAFQLHCVCRNAVKHSDKQDTPAIRYSRASTLCYHSPLLLRAATSTLGTQPCRKQDSFGSDQPNLPTTEWPRMARALGCPRHWPRQCWRRSEAELALRLPGHSAIAASLPKTGTQISSQGRLSSFCTMPFRRSSRCRTVASLWL